MLCRPNPGTIDIGVTAATIDGDVFDKIQKGILKMADSKALGSLSFNSVIINGKLFLFYCRYSTIDITDYL